MSSAPGSSDPSFFRAAGESLLPPRSSYDLTRATEGSEMNLDAAVPTTEAFVGKDCAAMLDRLTAQLTAVQDPRQLIDNDLFYAARIKNLHSRGMLSLTVIGRNPNGCNVMHLLVLTGKFRLFQFLMKHHARAISEDQIVSEDSEKKRCDAMCDNILGATTKEGKTVLHLAVERYLPQFVKLILEYVGQHQRSRELKSMPNCKGKTATDIFWDLRQTLTPADPFYRGRLEALVLIEGYFYPELEKSPYEDWRVLSSGIGLATINPAAMITPEMYQEFYNVRATVVDGEDPFNSFAKLIKATPPHDVNFLAGLLKSIWPALTSRFDRTDTGYNVIQFLIVYNEPNLLKFALYLIQQNTNRLCALCSTENGIVRSKYCESVLETLTKQAMNVDGDTALHLAIKYKRLDCLRTLCSTFRCIDAMRQALNVKNAKGLTARDLVKIYTERQDRMLQQRFIIKNGLIAVMDTVGHHRETSIDYDHSTPWTDIIHCYYDCIEHGARVRARSRLESEIEGSGICPCM